MLDVCVIGHVTRDRIRTGADAASESAGGSAYYTSIALRRLGLEVGVVTKLAAGDRQALLAELEQEGVGVSCADSRATTTFEISYPAADPDSRSLRVTAVADPFQAGDLAAIEARALHLAPVMGSDMAPDVLERASRGSELLALGVQGLVRQRRNAEVVPCDWEHKREGLPFVHLLMADIDEARILTGERDPGAAAARLAGFGPREVVVTDASRGSLVLAEGRVFRIPAFPPLKLVDATGCGDSYAAGYLRERLAGAGPEQAGRFGAAVAAIKLESRGPFRGAEAEVRAMAARFG